MPESEWVSRFFGIASGISTEKLQDLWGRILAGEIERPGSFSLRTLDALRNLSLREAESFAKLGNYMLRSGDKYFYIDPTAYLFTKDGGPTFLDLLALKDAGLIFESDLAFSFNSLDAGETSSLLYGPLILLLERTKPTPEIKSKVGVLTRVGTELHRLLTVSPGMDYVKFVAKRFHTDGIRFAWAPVLGFVDELTRHGAKTYIDSET